MALALRRDVTTKDETDEEDEEKEGAVAESVCGAEVEEVGAEDGSVVPAFEAYDAAEEVVTG